MTVMITVVFTKCTNYKLALISTSSSDRDPKKKLAQINVLLHSGHRTNTNKFFLPI